MGAIWAPFWGPLAEEVRWRQRGADVSGFVSSPCEVGEGGVSNLRHFAELCGLGGCRKQGPRVAERSVRGCRHPRVSKVKVQGHATPKCRTRAPGAWAAAVVTSTWGKGGALAR